MKSNEEVDSKSIEYVSSMMSKFWVYEGKGGDERYSISARIYLLETQK